MQSFLEDLKTVTRRRAVIASLPKVGAVLYGVERTQARSAMLAPSYYHFRTLGKSLNISEPQFPHLNKENKTFYIERVFLVTPSFLISLLV